MVCATCGHVELSPAGACARCALPPSAPPCGACGAKWPPDARFCPQCGRSPVAVGLNADATLATLRSNVSPRMAERVLRQGAAMIGERKRVTVLFADIRGSTELIDALDPEEAMATIAPIMKILMDVVHAHDGFVNQTRGDGIMALFGAPLANENHALDACAAALRMQAAVDAHAHTSGRRDALRVGINSGEVVVQSIGTDLSMNFDAVGRTVHLAARLEQAARPGAILLSQETAHLVQGFMDVTSAGAVEMKGVSQPITAYNLEGARAVTRWQARKALGLAPFKGRGRERAMLDDAVAAAERGKGGFAVITAKPGLGKSRLVEELIGGLPPAWQVLQAAGAAQRAATSYHPLAQLMHAELGVIPETRPDEVRARLEATIERRDRALSPFIPAMLSVIDVRAADAAWDRLDPLERRRMVLDAMLAGIASRAGKRPLLLVIEDAHWCDPETRHILESLADDIRSMKALIVLTQRPEGAMHFSASAPVTRIDLEPLPPEAARDLAAALLGPDISLASVQRRILDLACGNPLFIEELVQELRDGGHISGSPGDHRLARMPTTLQLPHSIHGVIAARIDQLPPDPKALLQTAAVIGRRVPVAILAHMLDREAPSLEPSLAHLEAAGLLFADGDGRAHYEFKHELIRDVAYGTMLTATRRKLHAKAMEFIEARYADRIEEHVDRLADHGFAAHLWAKALPYQMRSCRRALRRGANHEAISICERAREALAHLPQSEDRTKAEVDFALAQIIALEPLGRHQRIAMLLEAARAQAQQLGDPRRIAAVNCQLVVALWRIGRHAEAMAAVEDADAAARSVGDAALMFAARHNRGIVLHETGAFAEAIATFRACVAIETPDIDVKRVGWAALPSVVLRTFLSDSLLEAGFLEEAAAVAEEGAVRAEAAGHAYSRVQINQVRAHLHILAGRPEVALALLDEDWRTVVALDMIQMQPIIATRLGQAHLARGDVRAALEILAQPERLDVPASENAFGWRYLFLARGAAHLADHHPEEARACVLRALELALARGERPQQAHAQAQLADIAFAQGQNAAARRHLGAALALAESCGMGTLAAGCLRLRDRHSSGLVRRLRRYAGRVFLRPASAARI